MSKSDYFDHYFKIFKNTPIYKELANIHFEIEPEYLKQNPICSISLETYEEILEKNKNKEEMYQFNPLVINSKIYSNHFHFYELNHLYQFIVQSKKLQIPDTRGQISPCSLAFIELFKALINCNGLNLDINTLLQEMNPFNNIKIIQQLYQIYNNNHNNINNNEDLCKNMQVEVIEYLLKDQEFLDMRNSVFKQRQQNIRCINNKVQGMSFFSSYFGSKQRELNEFQNEQSGWQDYSHLIYTENNMTVQERKDQLKKDIELESIYQNQYRSYRDKIQNLISRFNSQYQQYSQVQNIQNDIIEIGPEKSQYFKDLILIFVKKNRNCEFQQFWEYLLEKQIVQDKIKDILTIQEKLVQDLQDLPLKISQELLSQCVQDEQEQQLFKEFVHESFQNYKQNMDHIVQEYLGKIRGNFTDYYNKTQEEVKQKIREKRNRKYKNYKKRQELIEEYNKIIDGEGEPLINVTQEEEDNARKLGQELFAWIE